MPANFSAMPAEIHLNILEQTRSEADGRLPLAISTLSKRLAGIVYPLLYRNILLENGRSVELFSRTLGSKPELAKHARHLLLGDADRINEVPPDFVFDMARSQQARAQRFKRLHDWSTARDGKLASIRSAAYNITSILSPYLHTLTILYYGHYQQTSTGLSEILQIPYPSLTDLTLMGNYSVLEDNLQMPKIENLHLIGESSSSNMNSDLLTQIFPKLKRIRLSTSYLNSSVINFMQFMREIQTQIPSITKVLLQAPTESVHSTSVQTDGFAALMQKAEHEIAFFHLIPYVSSGYSYEIAKFDWINRTFGGDGCWHLD